MRLYSYVSSASGLAHIAKILSSAKRNNPLNGITGLMSYNNGYYYQIIEGEAEKVDELVKIIQSDFRHNNIQTIFDISIEQRYFPGWSMKLVPLLNNCKVFQAFMMEMKFNIDALSPQKHELLENFYRSPRYSYSSKHQLENWNACAFSVDHWPDFSEVPPTIELVSLCGSLLNNTVAYEELFNDSHYDTEDELRDTLNSLNNARCLVTSKIKRRPKDILDEFVHPPVGTGFMSKMRDFLNTRLH